MGAKKLSNHPFYPVSSHCKLDMFLGDHRTQPGLLAARYGQYKEMPIPRLVRTPIKHGAEVAGGFKSCCSGEGFAWAHFAIVAIGDVRTVRVSRRGAFYPEHGGGR